MVLNWENLPLIKPRVDLNLPTTASLALPEKVLQFGTGVLLRGLPDYFIHLANQQGIFNGQVVVVKSTASGDTSEFDDQNNLYTICIRGIENGEKVEQNIICSAISRVLTAGTQWADILHIAKSSDLEIVLSNTTEVGIQLVEDDIHAQPPVSFPGKLLAVLLARYRAFSGDSSKGLVIVPTELIPGNGTKLKEIVVELASRHQLDEGFMNWLAQCNTFCNSLVDRIVPGKPDADTLAALEADLGYHDDLLTMSEVYRLWAIEGDERVQQVLSFARADAGVVVAPDIDIYRELKLRLLNGTHTLSCGVAFLAGFETVKNAMDDETLANYMSGLMQEEIARAIPYPVAPEAATQFSRQVLDRFRNPHIRHLWLSITMGYSAKLRMRVLPVLQRYYEHFGQVPEHMALGFAAYLLFTRPVSTHNGQYFGLHEGKKYLINDDKAAYFYELGQGQTVEEGVDIILANQELWGTNLTQLPGFAAAVKNKLNQIQQDGALAAIRQLENKQVSA